MGQPSSAAIPRMKCVAPTAAPLTPYRWRKRGQRGGDVAGTGIGQLATGNGDEVAAHGDLAGTKTNAAAGGVERAGPGVIFARVMAEQRDERNVVGRREAGRNRGHRSLPAAAGD